MPTTEATQSAAAAVTIEIRENGPLIVTGLKRLVSTEGEEMETRETVALCRCGNSANKPFCDGTHKRVGFSGLRESERPLHAKKTYAIPDIAIHDNRTICAHAAHCIADLADVFNAEARPWINPEGASAQEIVALIRRCPSGALSYTLDGMTHNDFGREPEIVIEKDGPYRVAGNIELQVDAALAPPAPEHYTLCRCGASKNKPYCDGTHHNEEGWEQRSAVEQQP